VLPVNVRVLYEHGDVYVIADLLQYWELVGGLGRPRKNKCRTADGDGRPVQQKGRAQTDESGEVASPKEDHPARPSRIYKGPGGERARGGASKILLHQHEGGPDE
jgi:hypothetical protein